VKFTSHYVTGGSSVDAKFGDIDERFPVVHKRRYPTTTLVPSPTQPSMGGKFQPEPSQWHDVGHPHMGSGHWELASNPWIHSAHGTSSVPVTQGHLSTPPGPSQWRPPQCQGRAHLEDDVDR
jgi:hypothetical protein